MTGNGQADTVAGYFYSPLGPLRASLLLWSHILCVSTSQVEERQAAGRCWKALSSCLSGAGSAEVGAQDGAIDR